jgi:ankyrin repeat protein
LAAAVNSEYTVVKFLIENGAQILKPKSADNITVLHVAATVNDLHTLDYAIK